MLRKRLFCMVVVPVWLGVACAVTQGEDSAVFHKPIRLQADGNPIDSGDEWGHSGPALADVDGDGLRDLVVGDFSGKFRFYRNIGSSDEPKYAPSQYLMAGDTEAKVRIYCCIGSSPHFVDFDADGKLDFLSGSYDPGECYLFRGLGNGKFAARETIVDKTGKPIIRRPDVPQNFASFGSWPVLVDWDHDGDLDLLVGAFDGTMFLRINEGTRQQPQFAAANILVEAGGEILKLPGKGHRHASPAIADWDHDGLWDLLSGSEHGGVYLYRNVGAVATPRFERAVEIIAPRRSIGDAALVEAGAEPEVGRRTQIAVVDYNHDGKLDLLVGDFCPTVTPRPDLTVAERAEMLRLRAELDEAFAAMQVSETLVDEFAKRYPGDACWSVEACAEWDKAYQAFRSSDAFLRHATKSKELDAQLDKFLLTRATKQRFSDITNEKITNHGYVWLFLRK